MRKKVPQYIEVECDYMTLNCPVCGASADPDDLPDNACPHLAFVHLGELDEFLYRSDEFIEKTSKVDMDDEDSDDEPGVEGDDSEYDHEYLSSELVQGLLEKAGYSNNMVAIEITYQKDSFISDIYGFDFLGSSDDDKDDAGDDDSDEVIDKVKDVITLKSEQDPELMEAENLYEKALAYDENDDSANAFEFYRQAAEKGLAKAQESMGYMNINICEDSVEAAKWFRLAAEQGSPSAQARIGYMYNLGEGVEQDYTQAMRWSLLAAENGNSDGQFNVGWMYEKGHGVKVDKKNAKKWYKKAWESGHELGYEYYQKLKSKGY